MLGGMDFSHAVFATTEVGVPSSYFSCPRCGTVINESQVTDVLGEKNAVPEENVDGKWIVYADANPDDCFEQDSGSDNLVFKAV